MPDTALENNRSYISPLEGTPADIWDEQRKSLWAAVLLQALSDVNLGEPVNGIALPCRSVPTELQQSRAHTFLTGGYARRVCDYAGLEYEPLKLLASRLFRKAFARANRPPAFVRTQIQETSL